ncbi:MAG: FHA domain-containing protein, partial [Polyangiaceae bacterium]
DDDGTSRQHAVLERYDDRYAIIDQGSSNGTFVAGKPVQRHVLADGDLVNVGPACTLRYTRTDADSEALLLALHRSNAFDHLTET